MRDQPYALQKYSNVGKHGNHIESVQKARHSEYTEIAVVIKMNISGRQMANHLGL